MRSSCEHFTLFVGGHLDSPFGICSCFQSNPINPIPLSASPNNIFFLLAHPPSRVIIYRDQLTDQPSCLSNMGANPSAREKPMSSHEGHANSTQTAFEVKIDPSLWCCAANSTTCYVSLPSFYIDPNCTYFHSSSMISSSPSK